MKKVDKQRIEIKEGLTLLSEAQHHLFKRMYSAKNLSADINDGVDNMEDDRLEWALFQVTNSISKNRVEDVPKIELNKKNKTFMNITEETLERDLFDVLETAKTQGIKGFRINEEEDIWPSLAQRKEIKEQGYKIEYGQYQTEAGDVGFFCMIFFYPPKLNPAKTKTVQLEIEVEYTSASFRAGEFKKTLTDSFNTWGLSGYQIQSLTYVED